MMSPARHAKIATAVVMALLIGGCDEQRDGEASATRQAGDQEQSAQTGPRVEIDSDKTDAVQPGDELTLTIEVTDFTLDASKVGQANEIGVGHFRIYLDEASGDDYLAQGAQTTTKLKLPEQITDGSHDLRVVLHNNDQSPLEPSAEGSVLLIVYRL